MAPGSAAADGFSKHLNYKAQYPGMEAIDSALISSWRSLEPALGTGAAAAASAALRDGGESFPWVVPSGVPGVNPSFTCQQLKKPADSLAVPTENHSPTAVPDAAREKSPVINKKGKFSKARTIYMKTSFGSNHRGGTRNEIVRASQKSLKSSKNTTIKCGNTASCSVLPSQKKSKKNPL